MNLRELTNKTSSNSFDVSESDEVGPNSTQKGSNFGMYLCHSFRVSKILDFEMTSFMDDPLTLVAYIKQRRDIQPGCCYRDF